jgi:hypothetical protein
MTDQATEAAVFLFTVIAVFDPASGDALRAPPLISLGFW